MNENPINTNLRKKLNWSSEIGEKSQHFFYFRSIKFPKHRKESQFFQRKNRRQLKMCGKKLYGREQACIL